MSDMDAIHKAKQIVDIADYTKYRLETISKTLFALSVNQESCYIVPLLKEYYNATHEELKELPQLAQDLWLSLLETEQFKDLNEAISLLVKCREGIVCNYDAELREQINDFLTKMGGKQNNEQLN